METCINWCEPGWAWMSSDERVWINRLLKLAEERPGEVVIIKRPEENQGVIYCKFPQKWARVRPPKEMHLTDERRADLLKNLQEIRESKTKARGASDSSDF